MDIPIVLRVFSVNASQTRPDSSMFGLFKKNPTAKLEKRYNALLEKARDAQRSGDIKSYARISAQAEEVLKEIEAART